MARLPHGSKVLASFIDGLDTELERYDHALLVRYRDRQDDVERLVAAISPRAVLDLDRLYFEADPTATDGGWIDGLAAHTAVQIRYLVERGHSRIAMALPDVRLQRLAAIRFKYASQVVRDLGLPDLAVLTVLTVLTVGHSAKLDLRALHELLQVQPGITAIAGLDDDAALRVLAAARGLDVKVPGDLAVIGFDDTAHGELFSPSLTTVQVDAAAFGRRAARVLLDRPPGTEIPGPATVIARESA